MPYSKDKEWLDSLFSDTKRGHNNNAKSDATETDDDSSIFPPIVRNGSEKICWPFDVDEPKEKKTEKKKKQSNNNAMLIKKTSSVDNQRALLPPIGPKTSSSTGDNSKDTQVRRSRPTSLKKCPSGYNSSDDHQRRARHRRFDMLNGGIEEFLGRVDPATARAEYSRLRRLLLNQSEKMKSRLEDIDQQRQRIDSLLEENRHCAEDVINLPRDVTLAKQEHSIYADDVSRNLLHKTSQLSSTVTRTNQEIQKDSWCLLDIDSTEQGHDKYPNNDAIRRRISYLEAQGMKKADLLKDQVDLLIERYNSFRPRRRSGREEDEDTDGTPSVMMSEDNQDGQMFITPREINSDIEGQLPWINVEQHHNISIPRSILKLDKSLNNKDLRPQSIVRCPAAGCRPPSTGRISVMEITRDEIVRPSSKVLTTTSKHLDNHRSFGQTKLEAIEEPGIKERGMEMFYRPNRSNVDTKGKLENKKKSHTGVDTRKVKRNAAWLDEVDDRRIGKRPAREVRRNVEILEELPIPKISGWLNESQDKARVYHNKAGKRVFLPSGVVKFPPPHNIRHPKPSKED